MHAGRGNERSGQSDKGDENPKVAATHANPSRSGLFCFLTLEWEFGSHATGNFGQVRTSPGGFQ